MLGPEGQKPTKHQAQNPKSKNKTAISPEELLHQGLSQKKHHSTSKSWNP